MIRVRVCGGGLLTTVGLVALGLAGCGEARTEAHDLCAPPIALAGHAHMAFEIGSEGIPEARGLDYFVVRGFHALGFALPVDRNGPPDLPATLGRDLASLQDLARGTGSFVLAHTPDEVRAACGDGKLAVLPTLENLEGAFFGDPMRVETYADLGILYITLVNNEADSLLFREPTTATLTPLGRAVVSRMNRRGILIDISHLWPQEMIAIVEASRSPVIASHANPNLPGGPLQPLFDQTLGAMAAKGGLVMLSFSENRLFDEEEDTSDAVARVLDQIDHVREVVGVDHVGIGTDFQDGGNNLPESLRGESILSEIVAGLTTRGYEPEEVEKILAGNFFRVLEEARGEGS